MLGKRKAYFEHVIERGLVTFTRAIHHSASVSYVSMSETRNIEFKATLAEHVFGSSHSQHGKGPLGRKRSVRQLSVLLIVNVNLTLLVTSAANFIQGYGSTRY